MRFSRLFRLFVRGIAAVVCSCSAYGDELAVPDAHLEAIAVGYEANRDSLQNLTCQWTISTGVAPSIEDAKKGIASSPELAEGLLVMRDGRARFQLKGLGPSRLATSADPDTISTSSYFSRQVLKARNAPALTVADGLNAANLYPVELNFDGVRSTPLDMGMMGDHEKLRPSAAIRNGSFNCRYLGTELVGDVEGVSVEIEEPQQKWKRKYVLDPQRGFLPLFVRHELHERENDDRVWETTVTDIIDCGQDRWFPGRSVTVSKLDAPNPGYSTRVYYTVRVDTSSPSDDAFVIELPSGIQVSDVSNPQSAYRLGAARMVGVKDLQALMDEAHATIAQFNRGPGAANRGASSYAFVASAIGLILLACAVLWWRSTRREARLP